MNKLERYQELKIQMNTIQEEIDSISKDVLEEVQKLGGKYETDFGKFNIMERKVWEYPEYVEKAKEEYDLQKAKSVELREATFTIAPTLTFKENE